MFSRFAANKANAKAGHPAELGSGCSYSPLCGSVGCPALLCICPWLCIPFIPRGFPCRLPGTKQYFLHQSDQARAGFLRCPGDVRRDVQAVVVRHFSNGLSLRIGSLESTSSAAPAIRPSRRAQQRSRSFTIKPRPTLIRIAFRFMLANVSIFIRFSVASFNGAWMETTSESFSRR